MPDISVVLSWKAERTCVFRNLHCS